MKKVSVLVILSLMLMSLVAFAAPTSSVPLLISPPPTPIAASHDLTVNGVVLEPSYFLEGDTVMVPLRLVSEALGYEVKWFGSDRHIELTKGPRFVYVKTLDNYYAFGKMAPVKLTHKPALKNGVAYVPSAFVSDFLNAYASHNDAGVVIQSNMDSDAQTGGMVITKIEGDWIYATQNDGEAHIRLSKETTYSVYSSTKTITLADLKVGDTLKVTHPNIMLAIYPPQYPAIHIEKLENVAFRTGVITELTEDSIMIDTFENGIRLNVGKETLYQTMTGKSLTLKDLRIGNRVQVYHSMMTTFSIPPQSPGLKVIVE